MPCCEAAAGRTAGAPRMKKTAGARPAVFENPVCQRAKSARGERGARARLRVNRCTKPVRRKHPSPKDPVLYSFLPEQELSMGG